MGFVKSAWKATWRGLPVHVSSNSLNRGFHVEVGGKTAIERAVTWGGGSGHWEADVEVEEGTSTHVVIELLASFTDTECDLWLGGEKVALEREA